VYVSSRSQGPDAAGTKDDPLPTIGAGIAAAKAGGVPYLPVFVAVGTYQETLVFEEGVSISGGLDPDTWEYSAEPDSITVVDLGRSSARATGIVEATRIENLTLQAASAPDEAAPELLNSVALFLIDCEEGLRFVNCVFRAGDGGKGAPGDSGTAGADGGPGGIAGRDENEIPYNNNYAEGGPGGKGLSVYAGGAGGDGGRGGGAGQQGYAGEGWRGAPCPGGCGGVGAFITCSFYGGYGPSGADGGNGRGGTNVQAGTPDGWVPIAAPTEAGSGTHGCGGGGGGGGVNGTYQGMGGGGGGGGGNGGYPGFGGEGGGSSFAVYLYESCPEFVECEFYSGKGGDGGEGGNGGRLGRGGLGGESEGYIPGWVCSPGSKGGDGGHGGFGGSGGGGAGGHSFCVYRFGDVCLNADFSACRVEDYHPGAPGDGGQGGRATRGDDAGTRADTGAAGNFGTIGPQGQ